MTRAIDVSHHNTVHDWTAVKAAGYDAAFIRASHGATADRSFAEHWTAARAAGLIVGAYHYYEPKVDPVEQAGALLDMLAGVDCVGMLPPTLDVEEGNPDGIHLLQWLMLVEQNTGLCPWIYTMPAWWPHKHEAFARYPLWIAHWGVNAPRVPLPWSDWIVWQTGSGQVPGCHGVIDQNEVNFSLETLKWLAGIVEANMIESSVGGIITGVT